MGVIFNTKTATIAATESLSGVVALGAGAPVAIQMPAGWDAADVTFQGSLDGVNFYDLYDESIELQIAVDADRLVSIGASPFAGIPYLKVRSGTSDTPVAQSADRVLTFSTRKVAHQ